MMLDVYAAAAAVPGRACTLCILTDADTGKLVGTDWQLLSARQGVSDYLVLESALRSLALWQNIDGATLCTDNSALLLALQDASAVPAHLRCYREKWQRKMAKQSVFVRLRFVFMEELEPVRQLAVASLQNGWTPPTQQQYAWLVGKGEKE